MAKTPEGFVKDAIVKVLAHHGVAFHMLVLNGMGETFVDFVGCVAVPGTHAIPLLIEAKRADKPKPPAPTKPQQDLLNLWASKGAAATVVDSQQSLDALDAWLAQLSGAGLAGVAIGRPSAAVRKLVRE
jgi:hypothetical protein